MSAASEVSGWDRAAPLASRAATILTGRVALPHDLGQQFGLGVDLGGRCQMWMPRTVHKLRTIRPNAVRSPPGRFRLRAASTTAGR
jgi:hypothetical protein